MSDVRASSTVWSVDRRMTLALLVTLFVQVTGVLLWSGAAAQRLSQVERQVEDLGDIGERLARLEEQMIAARTSLARIDANTRRDERN